MPALAVALTGPAHGSDVSLSAIEPKTYVAYRASGPVEIDGRLDEPSWQRAEWTDGFVDSDGDAQDAAPPLDTRVKLLWDNQFLYLAADIEEPHVWATLTARDATIYHDNDFEVFIDADGDTHEYWELEVNAFGTVWDRFLVRPYRDGGAALTACDLSGLETGVMVWGTANNAGDTDEGWSLEMAAPWSVLEQGAHRPAPPADGDHWRMNFSRVEWSVQEEADGRGYEKIPGRHEETWVWSPHGFVDMHYPELWGFIQFSEHTVGSQTVKALRPPEEEAKRVLREIYYRQRDFRDATGRYTAHLDSLGIEHRILRNFLWPPHVAVGDYGFEAWLEEVTDLHGDGQLSRWGIRQDSRTWKAQPGE